MSVKHLHITMQTIEHIMELESPSYSYILFFVCLIYNSDPLEVCILQPWALDADIVLSLFVVCFVSNAQITRPPRHFECVPTS